MSRRVALAVAIAACSHPNNTEPPVFPADYAATYQEVRNCRGPSEHDLTYIRVLAAPDALAPYQNRTDPFPAGAIVLKEEYDPNDPTCAGPIEFWTVMEKLADGSSLATLDWHWQKVDAHRTTITSDDPSCINCHQTCTPTGLRGGYAYTCTMPP